MADEEQKDSYIIIMVIVFIAGFALAFMVMPGTLTLTDQYQHTVERMTRLSNLLNNDIYGCVGIASNNVCLTPNDSLDKLRDLYNYGSLYPQGKDLFGGYLNYMCDGTEITWRLIQNGNKS